MSTCIALGAHLRQVRDEGRKLLSLYITAGMRDDWVDVMKAVALAGADSIEIGIPFSDPVMDGPIIQAACVKALERGATPAGLLSELSGIEVDIPLVAMTYYNLVFRFGHERFAHALHAAGCSGVILPDLPLEESGDWRAAAHAQQIETVLLVAPNTPDDRLTKLCDASEGFVYSVGLMGVTGERDQLASSAIDVGKRVKQHTDKPVLIGVGISTPEQAIQAAQTADGVIIGSALVHRLLDGASPEQAADFVASFREALDMSG